MTDVPTSEIGKQLHVLAKQRQSEGLTRACNFNLVMFAKHNERNLYLMQIAKNLMKQVPCRVLFINEDMESSEPYLKARIEDVKVDEHAAKFFCEMIYIDVSHSYRERIPSLIIPNLRPEYSTFLLWGDNPDPQDKIALSLQSLATRTLFDSEISNDMTCFATHLLQVQTLLRTDVGDLNWPRFEDWRELFISAFSTQERVDTLKNAKSIRITYNNTKEHTIEHTKIQATYFQAWLATRLEWEFISDAVQTNELHFFYVHANHTIDVCLVATEFKDVGPGRIISVIVEGLDGSLYEFDRLKEKPHIVMIGRTFQTHCDLRTFHILDKEQTGKSIRREIIRTGSNRDFLAALKMVSKYTQGVVCS